MTTAADYLTARTAILRETIPNGGDFEFSSEKPLLEYVEQLLDQARMSTIPALILTDAIEGKVPVEERLNLLTSFAEAQFAHYSDLKVLNPKLGPYEALGRVLSGSAEFQEQTFGKTDREFIIAAWTRANPGSKADGPLDAVVEHYIAQLDYFEKLYQRVALSKSEALNWARGAVYGQIFGAVGLDDESHLVGLARSFLQETVKGARRYGSPLQAMPPN